MSKISILNRIIFLLTSHFAGYMVVSGIEAFSVLTIFYYTIAFGTLLLSSLLLMLFGFEILKNDLIIIFSMFIPAGLSLGLICEYLPNIYYIYLAISIIGILAVIISRFYMYERTRIIMIAIVHGVFGLTLFFLPFFLVINGKQDKSIIFISIGSLIISLAGLLQTFLKTGKSIILEEKFYKLFPLILLSATAFFVAGLGI